MKIFLNCYPRSGLTFVRQNILDNFIIDDKDLIKTHFHTFFTNPQDQITIVRNPVDSIISELSMQNKDIKSYNKDLILDIKDRSNRYINYHEIMINNMKNVIPFTFDQATVQTKDVMSIVAKCFDLKYKDIPGSVKQYLTSGSEFLVSSKEAESYKYFEDVIKNNTKLTKEAETFYLDEAIPSIIKKQKELSETYKFDNPF